MAHQLRETIQATFESGRGDWLAALVETFESTESLSQVPCDATVLRAMRAQLSRPTSTRPVPSRHERVARRHSPASCNRGS
ncbi:MAG: hypothetical protein JWQ94_948 [Tardiphaga sp.]|nr:hypothetical protein [Tardiphaga sp.]